MILRSLRLVNFRGVAALDARELPGSGAARVELPRGTAPSTAAAALRWAFLGRTGDAGPVLAGTAGHAWVEAGFLTPAGAPASVFRGTDRRGTVQVSLREEGGLRITTGEGPVAARLAEILGSPLDAWERETFSAGPEGEAGRDPEAARPGGPSPAPGAEIEAAEEAVEALRRALAVRRLVSRARSDFEELADLGSRLRRERAEAAGRAGRIASAREEARARLRTLEEARAQLERIAAAARDLPGPAPPPSPVETPVVATGDVPGDGGPHPASIAALGAIAVALALTLFLPSTRAILLRDPAVLVATGLAVGVAAGSCGWAVVRRRRSRSPRVVPPAPAPSPPAAAESAAEAVRERCAAIGDPADPAVADALRARLSAIDAEVAPAQDRLERLDDAIRMLAVEEARAARALGIPEPPAAEGERGLDRGESVDGATARVAELADEIQRACVERDAVRALGVREAETEAEAVEAAFARIGAEPVRAAELAAATDPDGLAGRLAAAVARAAGSGPGDARDREEPGAASADRRPDHEPGGERRAPRMVVLDAVPESLPRSADPADGSPSRALQFVVGVPSD